MIPRGEIADLLLQVPRPEDLSLPGGVTAQAVAAFEAQQGIRLPEELVEWLRMSNGPCVGPGGLYGVATEIPAFDIGGHLERHPRWKAAGWIPVAGDGVGNTYVLDSASVFQGKHPIYFVDHEGDESVPAYVVASGLWEFLWFLLQKERAGRGATERWPFAREYVVRCDPGIVAYEGIVSLPWEGA